MLWFIVAACVAISTASAFLGLAQVFPGWRFIQIAKEALVHGISEGVLVGLCLAVPTTLISVLYFREIERPAFYRLTMLTIALLVVFTRWNWPLENMRLLLESDNQFVVWYGIRTAISLPLYVLVCHIAAGRYQARLHMHWALGHRVERQD